MNAEITPPPTDEEAAAIAAAVTVLLAEPSTSTAAQPRWRWSGRWWTKPIALRRDRPW